MMGSSELGLGVCNLRGSRPASAGGGVGGTTGSPSVVVTVSLQVIWGMSGCGPPKRVNVFVDEGSGSMTTLIGSKIGVCVDSSGLLASQASGVPFAWAFVGVAGEWSAAGGWLLPWVGSFAGRGLGAPDWPVAEAGPGCF